MLVSCVGSNIKITPQVTSEYAKENKQLLVVNDNFETVKETPFIEIDPFSTINFLNFFG